MAQERGSGTDDQVVSLFSLMANTLNNLDQRRSDLTSVVALLALFNLFGIVNLVQDQGLTASAKSGGGLSGNKDLLGALMGMLADGGKPSPELLLNLLQKQGGGKKLNPQLLASLLSMAGEAGGGSGTEGGESTKLNPNASQERRQSRGII